ncbi:MAG: hypothetical protein JWM11_1040 [Planctomycetaceae bacterium]|nr:hypothetical protein [Planctomycetaceae bacterium]
MIGFHRSNLMWVVCSSLALLGAGLTAAADISPVSTSCDEKAGENASPSSNSPPQKYWAYRPVVRPAVPQVRNRTQVRTPIDDFILAPLEARGLNLSAEASKDELLRRAKFDLHGLPPTLEERAEFLADADPKAFERLVDRLLESPHYGERWGRMWLDVVRFADSAGYNADPLRPLAYKFRDYVIRSFNRDTPFDRFVQEQIAGDELFPENADALIGAGFNRLPPDESNASNILLARQDQLNDLTTSVGAIFLGQSLGCAQCHDHKFDAITQEDFYRIQAFFAGIVPVEQVAVGTAEQVQDYQRKLAAWLAETASTRHELKQLEVQAYIKVKAGVERRMKFPPEVLAALDTPPLERSALQQQYCFFAERQMDIPEKDIEKELSQEQKQRRSELKRKLKQLEARKPKAAQMLEATTTSDGPDTPKTFRLSGGSYNKPKEEVQPGFLSAISDISVATISPPRPGTTGRRTALARWLTDPANPLPARVLMNRLWQGHFGHGLAENANDFGVQSPGPTHPELLDWLAAEFVAQGWSVKSMHRLIMNSAVYRQATDKQANSIPAGRTADPGNRLYWHFDRRRLEGESLRDAMLATSGLLDPSMGGPGVRPELPANFKGRDWEVSAKTSDRLRRSVYIQVKRNLPYPFLQTFDQPDTFESCARRQVTTTGPQALTLLNSDSVIRYAQAFAGRLVLENPNATNSDIIRKAYVLAFSRAPSPEELAAAEQFLSVQSQVIQSRLELAEIQGSKVLLPAPFPKFQNPALGAALVDFCHALFNANEFLYLD